MRPRSASGASASASSARVDATSRSQLPTACHISRSSCGPGRGPFGLPRRSNAGDTCWKRCCCWRAFRPPATRFHRFHHSARHCVARGCRRSAPSTRHSRFTRMSSPASPKPGRRRKPARFNHRASCSGLRARAASSPHSTSQSARMAGSGHASRPASSAASSRRASVTGSSAPSKPARRTRRRLLDACRVDDHRRGGLRRRRLAAHGVAQAELEAPAVLRRARSAPQRQRADLGELRLELHRQRALLELAAEAQHGADGRQRREVVVASGPHEIAGALAAAVGRGEERETRRGDW